MKKVITTLFILLVSLCSYSFTSVFNSHPYYSDTTAKPPEFRDGGKTMDSLRKVYNCEAIEYENWEDDDASDSSLTVCFINSNKVPSGDVDQSYNQLRAIASQIKKAVKYPALYKSYYIIFVNRENVLGVTMGSHTAGANILSSEL